MSDHDPKTATPPGPWLAAPERVKEVLSRLTPELIRNRPEAARELMDSLPLEERVQVVTRFHGKERRELVVLSAEARALVQALPAPELWITIKEIGEEDAIFLLQMAQPAQLQHIADLEWWRREALDPLAVAYWLMLMTEAGSEVIVNWFHQADEELLVAAFAAFFRVYKTDPDDQGNEPWRELPNLWTLDDVYYLHFLDPKLAPALERALAAIRAEESMRYYALLDAIDLGIVPENEDMAARFRLGRLADYGFVEFEEALEIYAPLSDSELARLWEEAKTPGRFREPSSAPSFPLSPVQLPPLLGGALGGIEDERVLEDFRLGMAALINRILVADALDLTRLESVHLALAKSHAFVEMGLERWAGQDRERASRLLETQHVFTLFRAGYTRVLDLGRGAQRFRRQGPVASVPAWLDLLGEDGRMIEGLARIRPEYCESRDRSGSWLFREFRSAEEVRRAEESLFRSEFLVRLFFEALSLSGSEVALLREYYLGEAL